MRCASWMKRGRGASIALAGMLLVAAGCTNTTGPTPVIGGLWIANSGSSQTAVQYSTRSSLHRHPSRRTVVAIAASNTTWESAFDSNGNLWIATLAANTIFEVHGCATQDERHASACGDAHGPERQPGRAGVRCER